MMKKQAAGTSAARRTKAASPYGKTNGARGFSSGFMAHKLMEQAKVECKSVQFMVAKMPVEMDGIIYYKIILSNPIVR